MKSRTCSLATMYISTRLFVCIKSAHLYLVFAPVTPLVSHSGMAITTFARIENTSDLVLSILVSLVATLLAG